MPGLTPNQSYPYPLDTELIDVAGDIENLAEAVDADIFETLASVENKVDRTGDTMSGMLSLPGTTPTSLNHAARKGYVDTQDELRVAVAGDAMSGELGMGGNKITSLGAPTATTDAARKGYVDDAFITAVRSDVTATQSMVGPLRAPRFLVTDVSPEAPEELTSKEYVDDQDSNIAFGNVNTLAQSAGLLVQAGIVLTTLDGFASVIVDFAEPFAYAPVMVASTGHADQDLHVGTNISGITGARGIVFGDYLSTGAPAYSAAALFSWIAVGFKA